MGEIQAVTATLISLKTASDMVKAFLDVRGAIHEQEKIFELQRVILAAHQSALDSQEAQAALSQHIRDLEKKIADFETWDHESERYHLVKDGSVFAYALKEDAKETEPLHLLCAKCYEHRTKSILHHRIAQSVSNVRVNIISGPEVELVASIVPDPMIPNPSHLPATSVAIHMDQSAATILFARLRETFQTMGWPLPAEDEHQA